MFFSKEADKFLNAVNKKSTHRGVYAEGGEVEDHKNRKYRDDGGDVEDHKRGMRVHRKHRDDGGDVESKKRGKRVHARSHHADVCDVKEHAKGGRAMRPGLEIEAFMLPDKKKHHRKCHAEGGVVEDPNRD